MELRRGRRRIGLVREEAMMSCCAFICLCALLSRACYCQSVHVGVGSLMTDSYPQVLAGRRLVGGPGSQPPLCTGKCGDCTPCKPVHVSVPLLTTDEYYPEAWRCKCGDNLYMP